MCLSLPRLSSHRPRSDLSPQGSPPSAWPGCALWPKASYTEAAVSRAGRGVRRAPLPTKRGWGCCALVGCLRVGLWLPMETPVLLSEGTGGWPTEDRAAHWLAQSLGFKPCVS